MREHQQVSCSVTSQDPWASSSAKPCRGEPGFETLRRDKISHLCRNEVPREHPDGCFLAAFSSCRKADLPQQGEWVGVPKSPSTGLGRCWPKGQGGRRAGGPMGYRSQFREGEWGGCSGVQGAAACCQDMVLRSSGDRTFSRGAGSSRNKPGNAPRASEHP